MAILQLVDVTKNFGDLEVLKGINLCVEKGDFISIIGASGSGKSTLLTIMGGIDTPSSGQVILDGVDVTDYKEKDKAILRRTKIGFVFQFFNLAPYLTALENIELPLILNHAKLADKRAEIDKLAEYLKIKHILNKLPSQLSGGEQQRVAIARALIYQPEIILLDEPTGNLDSETARETMELLKNINRDLKSTIVQVTHSQENAEYGNKIIEIRDGLII